MKVYKKVHLSKEGRCYPLFIDKKRAFEFGEWMHCEYHPTKGFMPRDISEDNDNPIGGWHACFSPIAPHIADKLSTGEQRVWIECQAKGSVQTYDRPESQGGAWILCEWIKPVRILSESEVSILATKYLNKAV